MRAILVLGAGVVGAGVLAAGAASAAGPGDCGAGGAGCQPAAARAFTTIAVRQFPEATSQFWQAYGHGCARGAADLQRLCRTDPTRAARRLGLD